MGRLELGMKRGVGGSAAHVRASARHVLHRPDGKGTKWLGLAWLGLAWLGLAWLGLAVMMQIPMT
jgi:hypothetical protein